MTKARDPCTAQQNVLKSKHRRGSACAGPYRRESGFGQFQKRHHHGRQSSLSFLKNAQRLTDQASKHEPQDRHQELQQHIEMHPLDEVQSVVCEVTKAINDEVGDLVSHFLITTCVLRVCSTLTQESVQERQSVQEYLALVCTCTPPVKSGIGATPQICWPATAFTFLLWKTPRRVRIL